MLKYGKHKHCISPNFFRLKARECATIVRKITSMFMPKEIDLNSHFHTSKFTVYKFKDEATGFCLHLRKRKILLKKCVRARDTNIITLYFIHKEEDDLVSLFNGISSFVG